MHKKNAAFPRGKAAFFLCMILPGVQRPRVISKKKGGMKNENILYGCIVKLNY